MMHRREKSDPAIVAVSFANEAGRPGEEQGEPRAGTKGNAEQAAMRRAQNRASMSQGLDRIREVATARKREKFTALLHHVDVDALEEAFFDLKKTAAAGIDGMRWQAYAANFESNLADLHARVHRGSYRALPGRRVYIPKADGRQRPLSIAALEDKIVQRAVASVLNAVYEADFLGFSYGFRPGRGAHDALDALGTAITCTRVNYILDADIASFFDTVSQEWLLRFVEHRIGDPRILRLIRKWLQAGVFEDGMVRQSDRGTGQGSVISPLLANIYLHYVFDLWAKRWRVREATGNMILVRYADDIVVGFQHADDARRFWKALRERLGAFALSLHEGKTRLIEFGRYAAANRARRGLGKPETFGFLGFTHICAKSRKGRFLLMRKTRSDRMRAKLREVKDRLRQIMHLPVPAQGGWLKRVVTGYYNYFAVPTNSRALSAFRYQIIDLWRRTLARRSQQDRTGWDRIAQLARDFLPAPRILHPWPQARLLVKHPRWEPYAGKPHVRFCAGGAQQ